MVWEVRLPIPLLVCWGIPLTECRAVPRRRCFVDLDGALPGIPRVRVCVQYSPSSTQDLDVTYNGFDDPSRLRPDSLSRRRSRHVYSDMYW